MGAGYDKEVDLRLFIGIELPQDIKEGLTRIENTLKPRISNVKWVEKENFHITLRFLGEIKEETLKDIEASVEETANNYSSFNVSLSKIGRFPYVIWIGIEEGREVLANIAYTLEESLIRYNFPPADKPFSPHITLGRSRKPIKNIPQEDFIPLHFRVDSISIIQSTLLPDGPIYKSLRRFPFL
jgi:2'-5' RNA ligase